MLTAAQLRSIKNHSRRVFGAVGITDVGTDDSYQPFPKQAGADEGDTFLLEFGLDKEVVKLRLGDESLLDEFD